MTISFGAIGTKATTGSTYAAHSVAYPAGVAAGDLAILARALWYETAVPNTPTGWTQQGQRAGGLVAAPAVDAHQTMVRADTLELTGSESGTVSATASSCNGHVAVMLRYTSDVSDLWGITTSSGDDATHAANRSATGSPSLSLKPGDMVVAIAAVDTDTTMTITSPAITASGITFGTTNRRTSGTGTSQGNDGNVEVFDAVVSSGTGTVAPTLAFTTATTQCGPVTFLRLREPEMPVAAYESAWDATTDPKTVTVPGALDGDWLFVLAGSGHVNSTVTAATTSTTAGTTTAWSEPIEDFNSPTSESWVTTAVAQVTADGSVTVQVDPAQTAANWGFYVVRARNSSGLGNSGFVDDSATQVVNLTVNDGSAVAFVSFDWDAGAVGTDWTPSADVTLVERAVYGGTNYTVHAAYWTDQAAGTRNYGSTGAGGASRKSVALEIRLAGDEQIIPLGLVSETETAQAVAEAKLVAVGQRTETETALSPSIAGPQFIALGQAVETETVLAEAVRKAAAAGLVAEAETAQTATVRKVETGGLVAETETALAEAVRKAATAAQVVEAETALAVTVRKVETAAQVVEAEQPQAVKIVKLETAGLRTETETVQPATTRDIVKPNQAVETETAQPVNASGSTVIALGQAVEAEAARPATVRKVETLGQAAEVETPTAVTGRRLIQLGQSVESETVQTGTVRKHINLGLVAEVEAGLGFATSKPVLLGQVVELEMAGSIEPPQSGPGPYYVRRAGDRWSARSRSSWASDTADAWTTKVV